MQNAKLKYRFTANLNHIRRICPHSALFLLSYLETAPIATPSVCSQITLEVFTNCSLHIPKLRYNREKETICFFSHLSVLCGNAPRDAGAFTKEDINMAVSVLIVEDDRNIAELLQMYLEKEALRTTRG